jgi:integrase
MAKEIDRLTPLRVKTLSAPGRYADGGRLYLTIGKSGAKSWAFIYRFRGRTREAGLGAVADVTLQKARTKAKEGGEFLARKPPVDPLTVWRRPERDQPPTFEDAARAFVESKAEAWRSAKHRRQSSVFLLERCNLIARIPVNEITTADVLRVIKPIFNRTPDVALRLRGQIESVLNAARAHGHIGADCANPARWRGHLELLLPKRKTIGDRHFAAMPYADIPAFVAELRDLRQDANGAFHVPAYALEFLIMTGMRSNEVLSGLWSEVDWEARTWTLSGERMKAGREHKVPLSEPAVAILEAMRGVSSSPLIFPGARKYQPMSGKAFERLLKRMGRNVTTHGFRSSLRDWVGDETEFPREVAEAVLAHAVGDATERAYRRGSAFEKRRTLMESWSAYVTGAAPGGNIIEFKRV